MHSEKIYLQKRSKTGNYYLVFVSNFNGQRSYKKVSCRTSNKNEALNFLKKYEKMKNEELINPQLKISDIRKTVLSYAESNLSKGSYEKYELTLRVLENTLGNILINTIDIRRIEVFKSQLAHTMKKESVNSYVRYVKASWNLLVKLGVLKQNNLKSIQQFKVHEKEIVSFTESEIQLILNSIENEKVKNIVLFAVETGCRISEILTLRIKNIDFENELLKLNNSDVFRTKSGKNRVIPITPNVKLIIDVCMEKLKSNNNFSDNFLFVRKLHVPFTRNYITRYFRRLLTKLNFDERYHFHCLRATFIMNLVRKKVSPVIIQKLAGHSTFNVTQRYCSIQVSDLKDAMLH